MPQRAFSQLSSAPAIRRAGLFGLGAAFCFALMGVAIKFAAAELNNAMVVFLRNAFGLLALSPVLLRHGASKLRTQRLGMHVARCVIGLSAMYCFFFAIAHMPLAEAMLLNYSTPLYVPFIAWLWLQERPSARLVPVVLVGFVGVSLILRPSNPAAAGWVGLVGLASGVMAAGAFVAIRRLARTEPAVRIVFYFTALSLLISLLPLPWMWQQPDARALLLMAMAGACATLAQICLTRAYALAPAAQVAPFNYLVVVFAALWGWLIWNERSDGLSILGALIVVGSSLLALRQRDEAQGPEQK